jgi:hypothetical protein
MKTFDAKKVIIIYGGVPLTGFADGTFISVTGAADTFTKKVGADGEVARSRNNDDTSEVTLTLQQTSKSNSYLSLMRAADKASNAGALPLLINDLLGNTLFFWDAAWIKKAPDWERGKELGDQAWVFDTGQPVSEMINGDY